VNALDCQHRSQQHRPPDETALARECSRLVATGLTQRDVATALRLDPAEVLAWLQMREARP
jgi:DNA-binding CsgD family transcriptional regulator